LQAVETRARLTALSLEPERETGPFHWDGTHILREDERLIPYRDCGLKGMHNLANILAGLNAIHGFIPSGEHAEFREHLRQVLRAFSGIEHRMEFVAVVDDVSYYNDSKATNIESVKYAIESFDHPVFLILGGYDKDGDFARLIPGIRKHVKKTLVIGKDRQKIQSQLEPSVSVELFPGLPEAVRFAADQAALGDVVLLSPACASFDQYTNYEERGAHFKQLVEQLKQ
ncbi:MAG TPA: cyanophycin synthetase, partial [bacterium]|nr:cyanophycin synthetase [bacterium]